MNITNQLSAKLYLDRNPHLYDEILVRAIAEDNQFLVLEIAKRYGIRDISGLKPESINALLAYAIDCGIVIDLEGDKISILRSVYGSRRKIPYKRQSANRVVTYMNLLAIPIDILRIITAYLDYKDIQSLKLVSWDIFMQLLSIFNPEAINIYHIIRATYRRQIISRKLAISPGQFNRLSVVFSIDAICGSILNSVVITHAHLFIISQINARADTTLRIIEYLHDHEANLVLDLVPIPVTTPYSVYIAMLVLLTPMFTQIRELMSLMSTRGYLPYNMFIAIANLPITNRKVGNMIAHLWIAIGRDMRVPGFNKCYACGYNCDVCMRFGL